PRAIELAEQQPLHRPRLAYDARPVDRRGNVANTAHELRCVIGRSQVLILQDTVLERDDACTGANHWTHLLQGCFGAPQLDADHDEVDDADPCRIVSRVDATDVDRFGTLDAQTFASHGLKVLAARDEVHIRAPFAETGTEVAAQSARAHDCDTHALHLPL